MKVGIGKHPDNDEGGEKGWLTHRHTQAVARASRMDQQDALAKLLSACRVSTDIGVVRGFMLYEHYRVIAELAEGKHET